MEEFTCYQGRHSFFVKEEDDDECWFEMLTLTDVEFDEDIMEISSIEEIDLCEYEELILEELHKAKNVYSCKDTDEKFSCVMYKILMPDKSVIEIIQLEDDNIEWQSDDAFGLPVYHWHYDKSGKRAASEEEELEW